MMFYLDNWESVTPGSRPPSPAFPLSAMRRGGQGVRFPRDPMRADSLRRRAEQRMPQGINENYARELLELHTLGVDGGYSQRDVIEVARIFTGWSIAPPPRGGGFEFHDWAHDRRAKSAPRDVFLPAHGADAAARPSTP